MHIGTFGRTSDADEDYRPTERERRAAGRRRVWIAWTIYLAVLAAVALAAPGGL